MDFSIEFNEISYDKNFKCELYRILEPGYYGGSAKPYKKISTKKTKKSGNNYSVDFKNKNLDTYALIFKNKKCSTFHAAGYQFY